MTGQMLSPNGQKALKYAEKLKWPVIPIHVPVFLKSGVRCSCGLAAKCPQVGKHPMGMPGLTVNGVNDATLDPDMIRAMWGRHGNANIAVRTGRASTVPGELGGGDFFALDIDNKPGKTGKDQLDQLQDYVGVPLPDTVTQESPSGGEHRLFAYPKDTTVRVGNRRGLSIRTSGRMDGATKVAFPHIDVRGDGGYILVADSVGAVQGEAKPYAWQLGQRPTEIPIAEIPEAWLSVLTHKMGERPQNSVLPEGAWPDLKARIKRAKAYLMKMDAAVAGSDKGGHNQAFVTAFTLIRGFVLPEDEAYDLMMNVYNPTCVPPWSEKEIWHKLSQAVSNSVAEWGFRFENDKAREAAFKARKEEEAKRRREEQDLAEHQTLARMRAAGVPGSAAAPALKSGPVPRGTLDAGPPPPLALAEAPPTPTPGTPGAPAPPSAPEVHLEMNEAARRGTAPVAALDEPPTAPPAPPSGGGGPPGEPFRFTRGDESELAQAVRSVLDSPDRPLIFDQDSFWRYAGDDRGIWEEITAETVETLVAAFAVMGFVVTDLLEDKRRALKVSHGQASGARKLLRAQLVSEQALADYKFDNAWRGMAFGNGFLRLNDNAEVTLLAHHRAHMARFTFPFHWVEDAPHPMLDKALEGYWADLPNEADRLGNQRLVQEFIGGCLFGLSPSFAQCLVLYGAGGENGKSQLIEMAKACFPPGTVVAVPPHDWGKNFALVPMIGARANFVDEVGAGDLTAATNAKLLITGGSLTVDRKHRDSINVSFKCGHIFNCNELFATVDHSDAFFRRFVVLNFTRRFAKDAGGEFVRDIGKKIARHEQQGLVAWAVAGAVRLIKQDGYTLSASSRRAKEDWRSDSDPVRRYIMTPDGARARRLSPESKGVPASELYDDFKAYCTINGFGLMTITKFGRRLAGLSCPGGPVLERIYGRDCKLWKYTSAFWRILREAQNEEAHLEELRVARERLVSSESLRQDLPPDVSPPIVHQQYLDMDDADALAPPPPQTGPLRPPPEPPVLNWTRFRAGGRFCFWFHSTFWLYFPVRRVCRGGY